MRGPPLQTRVLLPTGQSRSLQTCCLILAHMDMNRGANKMKWGQEREMGSGHGKGRMAGKQSLQNKATAGGHSRQTLRPAQAWKKHNSWPALQQKQQLPDGVGLPLAVQCR